MCLSFHLSVHRRVPISHNALQHFPECHGADTWGGTLPGPAGGGVPCQVQMGGTLLGGILPEGYPAGGYPGRVPLARSGRGEYPARAGYSVKTTEGVLTTRRAVCLLRSRRRTFLLQLSSPAAL